MSLPWGIALSSLSVEVIGREFSIVGEPGPRDRQMTPPHSNRAVEVQNRVGDIANVDHHAIVERPALRLARRARLSLTTGKTHRFLADSCRRLADRRRRRASNG